MRTDDKVKKAVAMAAGVPAYNDEQWKLAIGAALDDIYANYICFGKDVPYEYFIKTAAQSLKLMTRTIQGMSV